MKHKGFIEQMLKFASVGVLNTFIDFGIFTLLLYLFKLYNIVTIFGVKAYIIAQAVSFGLAVVNSYLCNKYWTFDAAKSTTKIAIAKIYATNTIAFFITLGGLWLFHDLLTLDELIAKIIVTPAVMLLNFFATKYWVFGTKTKAI